MSPSKAEWYRDRAEDCCRNAIAAESVDRRLQWLEAAARWISFAREEGPLPPRQTGMSRGTRWPKINAKVKAEATAMSLDNAKTP
jgi:hypothetical protein